MDAIVSINRSIVSLKNWPAVQMGSETMNASAAKAAAARTTPMRFLECCGRASMTKWSISRIVR